MADQSSDFYSQLRTKMRDWAKSKEGKTSKWAEYLLFAPDLFHLLCKLTIDKDVPAPEKVKLGIAIAYFVSPLDLVPEAVVGPVGFVDDIALAAYVLNSIVTKTDPAVIQKHWAGDGDVLETIKHILAVANEMVGTGLWRKLTGLVK